MSKISEILTKEEKQLIKYLCRLFHAQKLWIDAVTVNVPKG